jgi:hypothetical protein
MKNSTLFIFEGQVAEPRILKSMEDCALFAGGSSVFWAKGDIYAFFHSFLKELKADGFDGIENCTLEEFKKACEDSFLDVFAILRKNKIINSQLQKMEEELGSSFGRNYFSQIFLFFDYDGHATAADDKKLKMMLSLFDDETQFGKLYISYPMVESLKDVNVGRLRNYSVSSKEYKKNVGLSGRKFSKYLQDLKPSCWHRLIYWHCTIANGIVCDNYCFPSEKISQSSIFERQLKKHNDTVFVFVINAFPVFLYDYYERNALLAKLGAREFGNYL